MRGERATSGSEVRGAEKRRSIGSEGEGWVEKRTRRSSEGAWWCGDGENSWDFDKPAIQRDESNGPTEKHDAVV